MTIDRFEILREVIIGRRSIYPPMYNAQPISEEEVIEILELAHQAPTHKKTRPWRFKVFHSVESRQSLSDFLVEKFLEANEGKEYPSLKLKKTREKPLKSGCVIAICMRRSTEVVIPEWEEVAAVACAVQNMWLGCTAKGIGAYWSSPSSIVNEKSFLGLKEDERCLGLMYMGKSDVDLGDADRGTIGRLIEFM